ncbi:hypothetical protein KIPB_001952, partial [Kipferlia bialata]
TLDISDPYYPSAVFDTLPVPTSDQGAPRGVSIASVSLSYPHAAVSLGVYGVAMYTHTASTSTQASSNLRDYDTAWVVETVLTHASCTPDSAVPYCYGDYGTNVSVTRGGGAVFHSDECIELESTDDDFEQYGCVITANRDISGGWAVTGGVQSMLYKLLMADGTDMLMYLDEGTVLAGVGTADIYGAVALSVQPDAPTLPVSVYAAPASIALGQSMLEGLKLSFSDSAGQAVYDPSATVIVTIPGGTSSSDSVLYAQADPTLHAYTVPPLILDYTSVNSLGAQVDLGVTFYGVTGTEYIYDLSVQTDLTVSLTTTCGKTGGVSIYPLYQDSTLDSTPTVYSVTLTNEYGATIMDGRQVQIGLSDSAMCDMAWDADTLAYSATLTCTGRGCSYGDSLHVAVYYAGSSYRVEERLHYSSPVTSARVSPDSCQLYMPTTFCAHLSDSQGRMIGGDLASPSLQFSTSGQAQTTEAEWDEFAHAYCAILVPEHSHTDDADSVLSIQVLYEGAVIGHSDVTVYDALEGVSVHTPSANDPFRSGAMCAHSDLMFIVDAASAKVRVYRVSTHTDPVSYTLLSEADLLTTEGSYSEYDTVSISYDPSSSYLAVGRSGMVGDNGAYMYRLDDGATLHPVGCLAHSDGNSHDSTGLVAMEKGVLVIAMDNGATIYGLEDGVWGLKQEIVVDLGPYYVQPWVDTDGETIVIGVTYYHHVLVYSRDADTHMWALSDTLVDPYLTWNTGYGEIVAVDRDIILVTNHYAPSGNFDITGPPMYVYTRDADSLSKGERENEYLRKGGRDGESETDGDCGWTLTTMYVGPSNNQFVYSTIEVEDGTILITDKYGWEIHVYTLSPMDNTLVQVRTLSYDGSEPGHSTYTYFGHQAAFSGETVYATAVLTDTVDAPVSIVTLYSGPSTAVVSDISVSPSTVHCSDPSVTFTVTLLDEDGDIIQEDLTPHLTFNWMCTMYDPSSVVYDTEICTYTVVYGDATVCTASVGSSYFGVYIESQTAEGFNLSQSGARIPMPVEFADVSHVSLLDGDVYYGSGDPLFIGIYVYDSMGSPITDGRVVRTGISLEDFTVATYLYPGHDYYAYYAGDVDTCRAVTLTVYVAPDRHTSEDDWDALIPYPVPVQVYTDVSSVGVYPPMVAIGHTTDFVLTGYDSCNNVVPVDMSMSVAWWPETEGVALSKCTFNTPEIGDVNYSVTMDIPVDRVNERPVLEIHTAPPSGPTPDPIMVTLSMTLGTVTTADVHPTEVTSCSGDTTLTVTPFNESGTVMIDTEAQLSVYFEDEPEERYLARLCETCVPLSYYVTVGDYCGVMDRNLVVAVASQTTPVSTLTVTMVYSAPWWYYALVVCLGMVTAMGILCYRTRGRGGYTAVSRDKWAREQERETERE